MSFLWSCLKHIEIHWLIINNFVENLSWGWLDNFTLASYFSMTEVAFLRICHIKVWHQVNPNPNRVLPLHDKSYNCLATLCICHIHRHSLPDVNFTNILRSAFMHKDSKSKKTTVNSSSFLCFWDLQA